MPYREAHPFGGESTVPVSFLGMSRSVKLTSREGFDERCHHVLSLSSLFSNYRTQSSGCTVNGNKSTCIHYSSGIGQAVKRLSATIGFQACFSSSTSLAAMLRSDKVKVPIEEQPGAVYHVNCACGASYIGETGNTISHSFNNISTTHRKPQDIPDSRKEKKWRKGDNKRPATKERPGSYHE
ncbi:hypothetical protein M514_23344 [Trichuris suis]|uniref:Uncharacterized protein n=1 Tax=Trichuris suis TaxID=68888 RepID=A0A085N4V1_9BILA|nr:hypothetical protein M514_23344 [Trichuris suis]